MNKKIILDRIAKKEARISELEVKSASTEDAKEIRSIFKEINGLEKEIIEDRGMINAIPVELIDDGQSERTKKINAAETAEAEKRGTQFTPGVGFKPLANANFDGEKRTKEEINLADCEKRGKDLLEQRAVTVASAGILLPDYQATTINPTFNQISSLIERVTIQSLTGGESYTQPYLIDNPAGDYSLEGVAFNNNDPVFGKASITKAKVTSYSESTEELLKLPAAPYEQEVMAGISKAVRRKITKEILVGDGTTNHLAGIFSTAATAILLASDLAVSAIGITTLDDIVFGFGGSEDVEDTAVLILNKSDLKAFSQLRTTTGERFHKITTNGNTGTIDTVPYIINSACNALSASGTTAGSYCMAYGPLSNYKLAIFSNLDVQRSTDFKFSSGQIAHRASIFIGGNVVAYNGFLRVTKKAAV